MLAGGLTLTAPCVITRFSSRYSKIIITTFWYYLHVLAFGSLFGRVLVLHLCDPGSNPTIGSFFFSLFFCLSRIRDDGAVRVNLPSNMYFLL